VAISNVPLAIDPILTRLSKKGRKKLTESIHNYFFAKTLEDLLRAASWHSITSPNTRCAHGKPVRQALADQADLSAQSGCPTTLSGYAGGPPILSFCVNVWKGKTRRPVLVDTMQQPLPSSRASGDEFNTKLDVISICRTIRTCTGERLPMAPNRAAL